MPVPAEGWEHVEARARDAAAGMLRCRYPIAANLVERSEAILQAKYASDEAFFDEASEAREEARRHVLPKQVSQAEWDAKSRGREGKATQVAEFYHGGNPYEAYKHRLRPSKFTPAHSVLGYLLSFWRSC
jgi:hypothetical protein